MPSKTRAAAKKNTNGAASKAAAAPKGQTGKEKNNAGQKVKGKEASSALKRKHSVGEIEDANQQTSGKTTAKGISAPDVEQSAQKKQRTETTPASAATNSPTSNNAVPAFTDGSFDIYPMVFPWLNDTISQPEAGESVDYTELHAKIMELQKDHPNSGKLPIHFPSEGVGYGRLRCHLPCFVQPMWNAPLDIGIEGITRHTNLELDGSEKSQFYNEDIDDTIPSGEGIAGSLLLVSEMIGIDGFFGSFKLFTTPVSEGINIYQGVLSSEVEFGGLLRFNGYAKHANECTFSFWLVPSKEDAYLECRHLEEELA
ncbi:hypothetical protein V5O48_013840 [Marasmius crinis-equi]|uniref:Uncharacterized protein n=1 Tax=Marasmius crinis-equi TaxID=585013 RepID=A0ABR3EYY0_9AGAR